MPSSSLGSENDFPPVLSAVQSLPPAGHLELSRADLVLTHSVPFVSAARRTCVVEAFHLVLILHLLVSSEKAGHVSVSRSHSTLDIWHAAQRHTRRRHNLALLAGELLEDMPRVVENDGDFDVEDILFAEFRLDSSSHLRTIRAIDLLPHPGIPSEILRHPLITVAISRLWKYGRARTVTSPGGQDVPYYQRFLAVYDSSSAPRIQHAVHLAFHTVYLVLLAHLALYPAPFPTLWKTPGGVIGFREPLIAIYSVTNILFHPPLSFLSLPHALVLIAFLFSLPGFTSPEYVSAPYAALLFAFCLHILFVQLPIPPTPVLLVDPAHSLPLSSLYSTFFTGYPVPISAFFLPIVLTSSVLCSISVSDTLLQDLQTIDIFASPPAARFTFLVFLILSLLLAIFFFAFVLLRTSSSVGGTDAIGGHWENYGADAGIAGRRALIRAVSSYLASPSRPMVFPPPLNIFSPPLALLSWRTRKIVWRIVVGPVAFLIAGFWCWGLL